MDEDEAQTLHLRVLGQRCFDSSGSEPILLAASSS